MDIKSGIGRCSSEFMHLRSRDLPLSVHHSYGRGRSLEVHCFNGSAMLEGKAVLISSCAPMGQVPAFWMTVLSINIPVKLFVCGLTFILRLVQVFTTSSGHRYRMPVAPWRISAVLISWWKSLVSIWEASNGNLGMDLPVVWDLKTPTLWRAVTSSSMNSAKSPAEPHNSVSILANGPTLTNGASFSRPGIAVWCSMAREE